MSKAKQIVSLTIAVALAVAVVVGAFSGLRWEAMLVLAWYSATLLGKRGVIESVAICLKTFHGGSAEYISFDGKVLKVRLGGACLGCPLSPATLHGWVEGTVRQFFPDIEQVEEVK